jgi:hypothetical protein
MISYWKLLAAWWADDETASGIPSIGAAGTYVATLDTTTRAVTWEQAAGASGAEVLVDDTSGEVLIDDATGNVLYDG